MLGILVMLVGVSSSSAWALAMGGYLELGGGSGEFEYDFAGAEEFDMDSSFVGVGFLLETSPMDPNKVFSYRLQAGFEARDLEDETGLTVEMGGLLINNTFAFGGNVSETVRLWGGPQVILGFYGGESDEAVAGDKLDVSLVTFGIGVAGGANFAIVNGKVIIPVTISLRRTGYAGDVEWFNQSEDISGYTNDFSISSGIMFSF